LRIRKAVITAAGQNQRVLPLQTLIDRDGEEKTVLGILLEQARSAGIEDICVVTWPGDEQRYSQALGAHAPHVRFIPQPAPRGYGDAIYCARPFVAGEPFLHLVGDHLYVNSSEQSCAERLVAVAAAEECAVSAVQPTRENLLPLYGAIAGRRVAARKDVYRVDAVAEKPTPTEAEQRLTIPGLRAGYYLCFFGLHVLTPAAMEILGRLLETQPQASLSSALDELARREQYLVMQERDRRYDIGERYGLLSAQFALALSGRDRSEVLARLLELLADREIALAAAGRQ
jgi:UTP--glucose-1-phosphate uridylyltransferase